MTEQWLGVECADWTEPCGRVGEQGSRLELRKELDDERIFVGLSVALLHRTDDR